MYFRAPTYQNQGEPNCSAKRMPSQNVQAGQRGSASSNFKTPPQKLAGNHYLLQRIENSLWSILTDSDYCRLFGLCRLGAGSLSRRQEVLKMLEVNRIAFSTFLAVSSCCVGLVNVMLVRSAVADSATWPENASRHRLCATIELLQQ